MSSRMSKDKQYHDGMAVGKGISCPVACDRVVGSGTLEDPFVYWLRMPKFSRARVEACEAIARAEVIKRGFPVVVIRHENHNTVIRKDANGHTVFNVHTGRAEMDPADWHLTLYLGTSLDNIVLQGHAYCDVDENRVPTGLMDPDDRTIVHEGKEKCTSEFYGIQGSLGKERVKRHEIPKPIPPSQKAALMQKSWRPNPNAKLGEHNAPVLRLQWENHGPCRIDSQFYRRNGNSNGQTTQKKSFNGTQTPKSSTQSAVPHVPPMPSTWGAMTPKVISSPARVDPRAANKANNASNAINRFAALAEEADEE